MTAPWFVELLERSLRHYEQGSFAEFVSQHHDIGDLCISDDGTFERLCEANGYVEFIQQFLDCWIDSTVNYQAYPDLSPTDWPDLGASLLRDIRSRRVPSHIHWNRVYTLQCVDCGVFTKVSKRGFVCPECNRSIGFQMPTDGWA